MTRATLRASPEPPSATFDLLVLDLDGVVYVGDNAVPGAVQALTRARDAGIAWVFATNNASRTPADVAGQLRSLGLAAADADVVTSAQAAADLAVARVGGGATVLAVGGPGVVAACRQAGLHPIFAADDRPAAVVQGYGRDVGWAELAEAAFAIQRGAVWIATNTDATLPTERGPAPGNGALVGAVRCAVDRDPFVAGKPEPGLFVSAAARAGANRPLVVGDRLDTDIAGAIAAGHASMVVLTGITRPEDLVRASARQRPDLVAADLGGLHTPHPAPWRDGDVWRCGEATITQGHGELDGQAPDGEAAALDLLRAACAAAWSVPAGSAPAGSVPTGGPMPSAGLRARWTGLGAPPRPVR